MAIRAGLWDLAEEISRKNPELRGELEAARKNKKTQVKLKKMREILKKMMTLIQHLQLWKLK